MNRTKGKNKKKTGVPRRMSKNTLRAERRRQQLFNSIARLMLKKPTGSLTLDEIALQIGGTKSTVYYYFKSKSDMLYKMQLYAMEMFDQSIQPILQSRTLTPLQRLTRLIRAQVLVMCDNWQLWRANANEVTIRETSSAATMVLKRKRNGYGRLVTNLMEEVVRTEGWSCVDCKTASRMIIDLINSMGRWYRPHRLLTAEQLADYVEKCLLSGFFDRQC